MATLEISDLPSICRGCLSKINTKTATHPINELYLSCTGLGLIQDERMPQNLCVVCYRKCEMWKKFQLQCQSSEYKILAILGEEVVTQEDQEMKVEMVDVLIEVPHREEEEVEVLPIAMEDDSDLEERVEIQEEEEFPHEVDGAHVIVVNDVNEAKIELGDQFPFFSLQCPICKKHLNNCDEFNNHLVECHMDVKEYTCIDCPEVEAFDMQDDYIKHIYSHVEFKFVCPVCGISVSSRVSLRSHLKIQHKLDNGVNFRQCHMCGDFAKGEHELKRHLLQHISLTDLTCFMCSNFEGDSDRLLAAHLYMHGYGSRKALCCEICGKVVKSQSVLSNHMKTHTNEKSEYPCDVCGHVYRSLAYLEDHKLQHTMEKTIKCEECGKMFYLMKQLKQHLRTHAENNRSYICTYCQRGFFNTSTLKEHVRIRHTLERLYPCDQCDRSYYRNRELIEHQRSHTGEKPFSCSICNRIYARKTTLMTHMKTHRT